jgi:hypothetical protein
VTVDVDERTPEQVLELLAPLIGFSPR